jgi:hypothetical protein
MSSKPLKYEEMAMRAAQLAQRIATAMNLAGLLASPAVMRRVREMPSREHILEHLDGLRTVTDEGAVATFGDGSQLSAITPHVARLRALCDAWTPSADVPAEMQQAARDLLAAFGIPEPPEGWDRFEGEPGNEDE